MYLIVTYSQAGKPISSLLHRTIVQSLDLTIEEFAHQVLSDLLLPLVSVRQELFLIIEQLLVCFSSKLKVGAHHNGINGTCFLAKSTVDALGHVNIVTSCSASSVFTSFRLNSNGLGWTDRFTELAGNATLVSSGVPSQRELSTETGAQVSFLVGVIDSYLGLETNLQSQGNTSCNLRQKEDLGGSVEDGSPRSLSIHTR
jgi:hypothetical protein